MNNRKLYKYLRFGRHSNLRIVSMIPGDLMVAGCFNFSEDIGGFKWKML